MKEIHERPANQQQVSHDRQDNCKLHAAQSPGDRYEHGRASEQREDEHVRRDLNDKNIACERPTHDEPGRKRDLGDDHCPSNETLRAARIESDEQGWDGMRRRPESKNPYTDGPSFYQHGPTLQVRGRWRALRDRNGEAPAPGAAAEMVLVSTA